MVDLIPAEYRRGLRAQRLLRTFGWTCLALVLAFGVSFTGLARAVSAERAALARYKQLQAQSAAWQARLTELKAQKESADSRLRVLDALRGGAQIGPLFDQVDAALNARVWFQDLEFSQGGETGLPGVEAGVPKAAVPGSGSVAAAAADKPAEPSQRSAHAEIRGTAADHAALADFIRQLGSRPGVSKVELRDTNTRSYSNVQVVDFRLAATIGVAAGAAQ